MAAEEGEGGLIIAKLIHRVSDENVKSHVGLFTNEFKKNELKIKKKNRSIVIFVVVARRQQVATGISLSGR